MFLFKIKIKLKYSYDAIDLRNRYLIADTIEQRGYGEVIDETIGEHYMQIVIQSKSVDNVKKNVRSLLKSFDFHRESEIDLIKEYS